MPRDITTTVYAFDELSEAAQGKAIENVRDMLARTWGDSSDLESITDTIVYELAAEFKSPGWDTYGVGDFPGIDGVTVDGWDLDRGQNLQLRGTLTRENAPALPWIDAIDYVELTAQRDYTSVNVVRAINFSAAEFDMRDAITSAIHAAIKAGTVQTDYQTSDENVRDWTDSNEPEFTEDGELN